MAPELIDLRKKETVQPIKPIPKPVIRPAVKARPAIKIQPPVLPISQSPIKEVAPEIKTEPIPAVAEKKPEKRISWQTSHFIKSSSKKSLYIFIFILLAAAGLLFFFKTDTLLAVLLILASAVLFLNSRRKPILLNLSLNNKGLLVDDKFYEYKELKSFWITYSPYEKELIFESKKWSTPYLTFSIEKKNPLEIRSLLMEYLPEKRYEKSLLDQIIKKTGI